MTQNNKPEWFEITDKDEKPELRKVSRSLPVSAVLVAALILGAGAVVTQTKNETPASASNATTVQSPAAKTDPSSASAAKVGSSTASKLVNPAISKLPTNGGDDEYKGDDD